MTKKELLNAMGWNNNNHGLWVEEEAFKSDYILFPTKKVKAIYKHCNTTVTGKKLPAWIKKLVVKLKKWEEEGWRSSFVEMTTTTASTARYVALIRKEYWETNFTVSSDDDSSSSSEEEDPPSRKKVRSQPINPFL